MPITTTSPRGALERAVLIHYRPAAKRGGSSNQSTGSSAEADSGSERDEMEIGARNQDVVEPPFHEKPNP